MAGKATALVVAFQGRLARFTVGLLVVALLQPGGQGVVEPVERENLAGADLAFQLALSGPEEAFNQSAGRRIAHTTVKQADIQREAGRLQGVGVINLGVVQVQLAAGPVNSPGPQQRIKEDVQVFPQVVAGLDHVAAVAVDEGREMRGQRLALHQHAGPILEIAQPQGVRLVPCPAAAELLLADAQLQPCGPGPFQVPIEGRFGNRRLELGLRNWLIGTFDRRGCSRFNSTALAITAGRCFRH